MQKILVGIIIGGGLGVGVSQLFACVGGGWALTTNPITAGLIGAALGGLFVSGGDEQQEQAKTDNREEK